MSPRQMIAHYRVTSKIGEGGMGEVWRATDTKLGRDVAIKILPESFAADPGRIARFEREAQILAALNHPNIAAIYGIENVSGTSVLVMELVEGDTLEQRIARGPIAPDSALGIAKQIAEALEAAQERGIVHRDLKPANIKITPEGRVKVLDFGLAAVPERAAAADPRSSPTLTMRGTQVGVIVGTASYMSPEQAAGLAVDKRADIWSYGVVLWEMLCGRRLFDGETISHTLADVLRAEIDLNALPKGTPAVARMLLRRCLERKLNNRLRDIGEARIALEEYLADPAAAAPAQAAGRRSGASGWIAAGVLAAVAAGVGWIHFREKAAELPVVRFSIVPPGKTAFTRTLGEIKEFAVSPDGRQVVFSATAANGQPQLWVRPLDSSGAQPLSGTEFGEYPFWSPDSRWIGFGDGREQKLKRIAVSGSAALTLADAPLFRSGTWNGDDEIVFANLGQPLQRIAAAGGTPRAITRLDTARGERWQYSPWFLPDGRHFLYASGVPGSDHVSSRLGSLDSEETRPLLDANSQAMYAEGRLLYLRGSTLVAQPFNAGRLAVSGDAVPVTERFVRYRNRDNSVGDFSVSVTGVLAYAIGRAPNRSLAWYDRSGKQISTIGQPGNFGPLRLSPDGRQAAVAGTVGGNEDIFLFDTQHPGLLPSRFTFDPAEDWSATWSPDGRTLIFTSNRKGTFNLYRKNADGAGAEELLYEDAEYKVPTSWSPDGEFLLYYAELGKGGEMRVLPLAPPRPGVPRKPYPWPANGRMGGLGQFSPDGKWVLYVSKESGQVEVYVAPFPGPGGKRQVSPAGGVFPRWRRDGREVFFVTPDSTLAAAEVHLKGGAVEIGTPHPLFKVPTYASERFVYDVAPDGQRFLVTVPAGETGGEEIRVVQNWTAGLKR